MIFSNITAIDKILVMPYTHQSLIFSDIFKKDEESGLCLHDKLKDAVEGRGSISEAIQILGNQNLYERLNFIDFLLVCSHHPEIAKIIFSNKDIHRLVHPFYLAVLCLNNTVIRKNFARCFKLNIELVLELKDDFESPPLLDQQTLVEDTLASRIDEKILILGEHNLENAKIVLSHNNMLTIDNLYVLAKRHSHIAHQMLDNPNIAERLLPNHVLGICWFHQDVLNRVVNDERFWKKSPILSKWVFAIHNEQGAHKLLDKRKYRKKLNDTAHTYLARSSLSISKRMLEKRHLLKHLPKEVREELKKSVNFCKLLSQDIRLKLINDMMVDNDIEELRIRINRL